MPDARAPSPAPAGTALVRGDRLDPRRGRLVLLVFAAPVAAWIASLAVSYLVQDFTCSAAASTGAPPPGAGLEVLLLALNAVLLLVALAAGGLALVLALRAPDEDTAGLRFLGGTAATLALLFAFGIVLIGVTPLMFETCT
jgi:hypothetical protein